MNQIVGSSVPIRIGKRVYLVSYVSMREWETFNELLRSNDLESLNYLIYCSLHRADSTVRRKVVKRLLKRHSAVITSLIDIICSMSLPKMKVKNGEEEETTIDEKDYERNVKTVYRILSRMHGWTPEQISGMSPAQVYSYLMGGTTGTGIEKMNSMQYQSFLAGRGVRN